MAAAAPTVCIKTDYITRMLNDEESNALDQYMQHLDESKEELHFRVKGGRPSEEAITFRDAWAQLEGTEINKHHIQMSSIPSVHNTGYLSVFVHS
jgi:hypothetical protein